MPRSSSYLEVRTDHERNKTHCRYGHLLAAPNLVRARAKRGTRLCLACYRARSVSRRGGYQFTQELANKKYNQIMKEAA